MRVPPKGWSSNRVEVGSFARSREVTPAAASHSSSTVSYGAWRGAVPSHCAVLCVVRVLLERVRERDGDEKRDLEGASPACVPNGGGSSEVVHRRQREDPERGREGQGERLYSENGEGEAGEAEEEGGEREGGEREGVGRKET